MPAYLKFFELEQSPFEGKAQAQVVLGTRALRDAFGTIQTGLAEGASRICVNGQRGLGKTSLARALPKLLGKTARVALVLDPTLSWQAARATLAKQWGLQSGGLPRAHLIEAARDQRLVVVIDQAERASEEFLDHLDVILSYRSEDSQPVVQSVLLARLTTTQGEAPAPLVWWLDRIQTLQLEFAPLPRDGIESYIAKHLKRAGWRGECLFREDAAHAIHGYTGGVPGAVSKLCEQLLSEAAAQNLSTIDAAFVHSICDVEDVEDEENGAEEAKGQAKAEVWTLEDEFEELALEDEFADADVVLAETLDALETALEAPVSAEVPSAAQLEAEARAEVEAEAEIAIELTLVATAEGVVDTRAIGGEQAEYESPNPLSFVEALEHFQALGERVDASDDTRAKAATDAACGSVWARQSVDTPAEDPLDALPTKEELRAIRGSGLTRIFRTFAVAAIAAVLGGIAFAMFTRDSGPKLPDLSDSLARTTQNSNRTEPPSARVSPALPIQSRPTEEALPLVMIQPGDGFVPIEMLQKSAAARKNNRVTKTDPIGIALERNSGLVPSPAQPASPAPLGDDLTKDLNSAKRLGSR